MSSSPAPERLRGVLLADGIGLGTLAGLATSWLAGWSELVVRRAPSALALAVGVAAATAVIARLLADRRARAIVFATTAASVLAGLVLARAFFDVSWDGQAYHQEAILALAGGWNPLRDGPLPLEPRPDNLWINHYPKASWIAGAAVFRASGAIELAKGLQLPWMLAAGALSVAALLRRGCRPWAALALGGLAACNPIVLAQLATSYIDGLLASSLLVAAALAGSWWIEGRARQLVGMGAALAFAINLKFTGLVYAGFLLAAVGVLCLVRARDRVRTFAAVAVTTVVLATCVVGADPYLSNLRRAGHPFFPLMGRGAVDIITPHVSRAFHDLPRPARLAISLVARATDRNEPPAPKWPWLVFADELEAFGYPDPRLGGFGPLFAAALLVAVIVAWAAGPTRGALVLAAALVGSTLPNPGLWWARYVPQLWALPLVALALAWAPGGHRRARVPAALLAAVLVANVGLVAWASIVQQARHTRDVTTALRALAPRAAVRWNGFESNRQRFTEQGIAFEVVPALSCAHPRTLPFSLAEVCAVGEDAP